MPDRLVVGGDLNIDPDRDSDGRAAAFLARLHATGLIDLLPASDRAGARTYMHATDADRTARLDYLFATAPLAEICTACWVQASEDPDVWAYSDHSPVVADFELELVASESPRTTMPVIARDLSDVHAGAQPQPQVYTAERKVEWIGRVPRIITGERAVYFALAGGVRALVSTPRDDLWERADAGVITAWHAARVVYLLSRIEHPGDTTRLVIGLYARLVAHIES